MNFFIIQPQLLCELILSSFSSKTMRHFNSHIITVVKIVEFSDFHAKNLMSFMKIFSFLQGVSIENYQK